MSTRYPAVGYRVWVLEAARRSLATRNGTEAAGGEAAGTATAAAAAAAAAALAVEQRVALAALGRMWTWAPSAVAGMGETPLGGAPKNGEA